MKQMRMGGGQIKLKLTFNLKGPSVSSGSVNSCGSFTFTFSDTKKSSLELLSTLETLPKHMLNLQPEFSDVSQILKNGISSKP